MLKLTQKEFWSIRSYSVNPNLHSSAGFLEEFSEFPIESNYFPPHCPKISKFLAPKFCFALLKRRMFALACPLIDPKLALFAGAAVKEKGIITLEIARGPVMVRKVTREGLIDERHEFLPYYSPPSVSPRLEIQRVLYDLRNKMPENTCIELSYYSTRIGKLNQHQIYWDIYGLSSYPNMEWFKDPRSGESSKSSD